MFVIRTLHSPEIGYIGEYSTFGSEYVSQLKNETENTQNKINDFNIDFIFLVFFINILLQMIIIQAFVD